VSVAAMSHVFLAQSGPAMQWTDPAWGEWPGGELLQSVLLFYGLLLLIGLGVDAFLVARFRRDEARWRRGGNHLLWRPWRGLDMAHVLIGLFGLHALVFGVVQAGYRWGGWLEWDEATLGILTHSLALHWGTLLVVGLLAARHSISWRAGFGARRGAGLAAAGRGVVAYVAMIPLFLASSVAVHVWLQWTGHEPAPQDVVLLFAQLEGGFMFYYFIFLAVVLAPLAEEVLFRGILLPALGRRLGLGPAILISSALFALIHFHVPALAPLLVLSVALSLAYIYTRSLVAPVVMHVLFNAVSLTVMRMIG
jgi:membrane protease YdiL (CAAX protease family)